MSAFPYFVFATLLAASMTALICRTQWARRRHVLFVALAGVVFITSLTTYISHLVCAWGSEVFTAGFWSDPIRVPPLGILSFFLLLTAAPSALATLAVAAYCRLRRKHENDVA